MRYNKKLKVSREGMCSYGIELHSVDWKREIWWIILFPILFFCLMPPRVFTIQQIRGIILILD